MLLDLPFHANLDFNNYPTYKCWYDNILNFDLSYYFTTQYGRHQNDLVQTLQSDLQSNPTDKLQSIR